MRRQVAPISPQPVNGDFMNLGSKGKRVICVFHIDPCIGLPLPINSLSPYAKKVELNEPEEDGYLSDSSDHEYWFTKWSKPLRTVRKLMLADAGKEPKEENNQPPAPPPAAAASVDSKDISLSLPTPEPDPCKYCAPSFKPINIYQNISISSNSFAEFWRGELGL